MLFSSINNLQQTFSCNGDIKGSTTPAPRVVTVVVCEQLLVEFIFSARDDDHPKSKHECEGGGSASDSLVLIT